MKWEQGFSMISLVITITLVGIMAAYVFVSPPPTEAFSVEGAANVFAQDLKFTKSLSMSMNEHYRMVVSANSYQIQNQSGTPITIAWANSTTAALPAGVTVSPTTTLIFDSLGKPYNGGSPLSATQNFILSSGTSSANVSVTPQTGYIQ